MKIPLDRELITRNVIWSICGQVLPAVVAIFILPIFMRNLGIERFGVYVLLMTILIFCNVADLGIGTGLTHLLSKSLAETENKKEKTGLISNGITLLLLVGLLGLALILIFKGRFLVFLKMAPSHHLYTEASLSLLIIALLMPLIMMGIGFKNVLLTYQKLDFINAIEIFHGFLRFLVSFIVSLFSQDLVLIFLFIAFLQLISYFIYRKLADSLIQSEGKDILRSLEWHHTGPLLKFSGWIGVSTILGSLMIYLDRFLIGVLMSVSAVPYYSVPYDLTTRVCFIPTAFNMPLFPFLSANSQDHSFFKKIFLKNMKFLFIIIFPLTLLLFTFSHEGLALWLGREFADKSYRVLQLLAVGVFINSCGLIILNFILAKGRSDIPTRFHFIEIIFYVPLLFFLIKHYGIQGAALAWVLRVVADTGLLFCASVRLFSFDTKVFKELMVLCLFMVCIFLSSFLCTSIVNKIYFVSVSIILFLGWMWGFILDKDDISWLKQLIFKRK